MLENLKTKLSLFIGSLLLSFNLSANEWTTGTNSILDLRNYTETTQYNLGDDSRSGAVGIGFDFDFYNQTYTQGYISTNGCFSFTTAYCNDYTPDPLPDTNHTIYPFWTDLIRDNGSKILSKKFEVDGANDYFVVGWYNLREYNRSSDNTFELLLYENNSAIEFRYGDLDIINHDVLIGLQGTSTEYTQYLFHDECNTGTTNVAGTCVNTNWNNSNFNTLLENKSLSYSNQCAINPLSSTECAGYQVAYFTQQCGLNPLYDNACVGYWQAFDDQQCDLDPQYAPFCPGYTQEQSVAYFIADDFDYGYEEEYDYGYVEEEYFWEEPPEYIEEFYVEEFYEEFLPVMLEEYSDAPIWLAPSEEFIPFEELVYMVEEELPESMEDLPIFEEEMLDSILDFEEYDLSYMAQAHPSQGIGREALIEEAERLILREAPIDEPIEEAIEFESIEELEEQLEEFEELEEEIEELEEEIEEEELEEDEKENKIEQQLKVVQGTMLTAINSVSGTTAGTSLHSTGTSRASGGTSSSTTTSASVSGSTGSGISFSSSPSISAQIVSSAVQTQQVLTMSSAVDTGAQSSMGATSEATTVASMDTGTSEVMTTETASTTVDTSVASTESTETAVVETSEQPTQTVAQNIKQQQQEMEEQQSETGEYADSSELIAIMGTVEGFDVYRTASMPPQPTWYEPKDIYASAVLPDNVRAFAGLASASINQLTNMRNLQPNLDGGNHGMVK